MLTPPVPRNSYLNSYFQSGIIYTGLPTKDETVKMTQNCIVMVNLGVYIFPFGKNMSFYWVWRGKINKKGKRGKGKGAKGK